MLQFLYFTPKQKQTQLSNTPSFQEPQAKINNK